MLRRERPEGLRQRRQIGGHDAKASLLRQVLHKRLTNLTTCTGHQDGFFTHTFSFTVTGLIISDCNDVGVMACGRLAPNSSLHHRQMIINIAIPKSENFAGDGHFCCQIWAMRSRMKKQAAFQRPNGLYNTLPTISADF